MDQYTLRPIVSLRILDKDYDLARNGTDYHIVDNSEIDVYGNRIARKMSVAFIVQDLGVQSLINLLGESYTRMYAIEKELSKAHNALQRESDPEAKRRPVCPPNREVSVGVVGILEKGEEG